MNKVCGDTTGIYDGLVRIVCGDKGKTIVLSASGDGNDKPICLNDCLEIIGYDGKDTVVVIFESFLYGKVYIYGNYGQDWYEYGETEGFA